MFKYYIIILCFVFSTVCKADDPFFANRGHTLTQDAWVFTPEKAKSVRDRLIDLDTNIKLNESLNKSLDLYKSNEAIQNNKINLLLEHNDKLAKNLMAERTVGSWERVGWFALGIAATVFAGWSISRIK